MEPERKLYIEIIYGYRDIKCALLKHEAAKVQYDNTYVLFTGDKDKNGLSWCSDCEKAEPVIERNLDKIKGRSVFYYCFVGDRDQWKNPTNPFRVDQMFQLKCIPTLVKVGTPKRLTEDQCCRDDLLDLIFADDEASSNIGLVQ
ncbi:Thioredoxin domain-containing protein 17 [Bulinus truncatus]|nr:Thioredoxin domain-containing protein 17 [Bulinus truncatus]